MLRNEVETSSPEQSEGGHATRVAASTNASGPIVLEEASTASGVIALPRTRMSSSNYNGGNKRCVLSWNDLNAFGFLKNNSGVCASGEVMTVVGPSGSGKSLLLNILAHRVRLPANKRRVRFNGKQLTSKQRRDMVGFVSQDDALLGAFTCEETLWFSGRFLFGYGKEMDAFLTARIDSLLQSLGLTSCKDTVVGTIFKKGISGGQRKRLSLAVELLRSPPVILLDEPTTGLDSSAAYAIVKEITTVAALGGHVVLFTIHQPSSEIFTLFSQIMVLSSGETVYQGLAREMVGYFSTISYECPRNFNPCDFILALCSFEFDASPRAVEHNVEANDEYDGYGFKRPKALSELTRAFAGSEAREKLREKVKYVESLGEMRDSQMRRKSLEELTMPRASGGGGEEGGGEDWQRVDESMAEDATAFDFDDDDPNLQGRNKCLRVMRRYFVASGGVNNVGPLSNLATLLHRYCMAISKNPGMYAVRFVIIIAFALAYGLVFLNSCRDNYSSSAVVTRISAVALLPTFMGVLASSSVPFFIEDRAVFLREKRNGLYTPFVYATTIYILAFPIVLGLAIIPALISHYMIPMNRLGWITLSYWAFLMTIEMVAYLVASLSSHFIIGISVFVSTVAVFMLLSGFFIIFTSIPWYIRWAAYLSPNRYLFRLTMRNEFESITHFDSPQFSNGTDVLTFYSFTNQLGYYNIIETKPPDAGVMFAMSAAYAILFWMVLEWYWK